MQEIKKEYFRPLPKDIAVAVHTLTDRVCSYCIENGDKPDNCGGYDVGKALSCITQLLLIKGLI